MYHRFDPDEYEIYWHSTPCASCKGDFRKCNSMCSGSSGGGLRRRPQAEIDRIKAERRRQEEDEILAKADKIRWLRGLT